MNKSYLINQNSGLNLSFQSSINDSANFGKKYEAPQTPPKLYS